MDKQSAKIRGIPPMLIKMPVEEFCRVLGSDSPAPGGGSVAALSGALGAALISMICRLSIGKKDYETFENELKDGLQNGESLTRSLLHRVDLDAEAFNGVMAAFKLPKATEDEKKARSSAIQKGYKQAVESPLGIARECLSILRVADKLVGKTNVNALSDLGVAATQAHAGLEGAIMNVSINIPSIKDHVLVAEINSEVSELRQEGAKIHARVQEFCWGKLRAD